MNALPSMLILVPILIEEITFHLAKFFAANKTSPPSKALPSL